MNFKINMMFNKKLKKRINDLEIKVWKLENPPKYKVRDFVEFTERQGGSGWYLYFHKGKIISIQEIPFTRIYTILVSNEKIFEVYESSIQKKIKN